MDQPISPAPNAGMQSLDRFSKAIEELHEYEKKNLRLNRIRLVLAALALAVCIVLLWIVMNNVGTVVERVNEVSEVVKTTGGQMNAVAEDLNKVDFETLGKTLQTVADLSEKTLGQVYTATDGLDGILANAKTAVENLSSIDIQKLNEGIQALNDVLEPVAKFFNIIPRF